MMAAKKKIVRRSITDMMRDDGYIPTRQAADLTGGHITTVYRWIEKNQVRNVQIARMRFLLIADLIALFIGSPTIQKRLRDA